MKQNISSDSNPLRFDGIYYMNHESGVFFVLRFYEKGIVCGGYVTMHPKVMGDLGYNFDPNTANHGCGKYMIFENSISFSIMMDEGTINYDCSFAGKKLKCNILSDITNKQVNWTYKFVKT